eukprot:5110603-Amphidinium_carterae.1
MASLLSKLASMAQNGDSDEIATEEGRKPISLVIDKAEAPLERFQIKEYPVSQPCRRNLKGCDAFVIDGVLAQ